MSLDYVVFCRERPRFAPGYHALGPVAVHGPEYAGVDAHGNEVAAGAIDGDDGGEDGDEDDEDDELDDWALAQIPRDERAHAGRWRVRMSCNGRGAEHANELGKLIAMHSGGGWVVCDHFDEGEPVEPAQEPWPDEDILPCLTRAVAVMVTYYG